MNREVDKLEAKVEKLTTKIDILSISSVRIEESIKQVHTLLEIHDKKAAKALVVANEALEKTNEQGAWLSMFPKLKSIAGWATAMLLLATYYYKLTSGDGK